jgi:hypothetical protein
MRASCESANLRRPTDSRRTCSVTGDAAIRDVVVVVIFNTSFSLEILRKLAPPRDMVPPLVREYLSGSLAASFTAGLLCPLETVKTRMQLQEMPGAARTYRHGFAAALLEIARADGLRLLWSHGFAAMVARDFFYSGVRTGMYPSVRGVISGGRPPADVSVAEKIAAGAVTGSFGSALANPIDVVRVRMMAEGGRVDPATGLLRTGMRAGHAPRWRSSMHCLAEAARHDGVLRGLVLRGAAASMSRAALLTAAQMSTYDHAKVVIKRRGWLEESVALHVVAAALSGLAATIACNPADVLKSRLMATTTATATTTAATATSSTWRAVVQVWSREGAAGFMRGFGPHFARLGPTAVIQMPLAEALRSAFGVRAI